MFRWLYKDHLLSGEPPQTPRNFCAHPKLKFQLPKGKPCPDTPWACVHQAGWLTSKPVTKPSSPQWLGLSCLAAAPLLASVGQPGQPNSWPFAKWTITSFCPHAQLVPCVYSRFSPSLGVSFAGEPCSSSRGALCS